MKTILEKLLNKTVGERDIGAVETHHLMEGLPLLECSRQFVPLNIGGQRRVVGKDIQNEEIGETTRKVEVK